jgi:uncharacterized protein involved in outer membrane biogenesis
MNADMSQPAAPPAEKTVRRHRLLVAIAVLIAVLAGLYLYQYVTRGRFWQETFEAYASKRAGRPVRVAGNFELYLAPGIRFRADALTVGNPEWAEQAPFFSARRIALDAPLLKALFGQLTIADLTLDGGRLALQRRADGSNNWTFGGGPLELPEIVRAAVTDSRLRVVDAPSDTRFEMTLGAIAATARGGVQRIAGPLVFDGKGVTHGAPFTLSGRLTTPNEAAAGGRLGLDLAGSIARTRITLAGTLPSLTRIDGADLRISARGRNLQDPGALFGVILPATRPYALTANLTKVDRQLRLTRLAGRIGSTDIAGALTGIIAENAAGRFRLDGTLTSNVLDIKDVGPLVGYDPERLEAGKSVVVTVAGRPRLLPDAPLAIEAIGKFDARIDYRATKVRTGKLPFDNFHLGLDLDDRLLSLTPLAFDIAGGRLTAKIAINARTPPVVTDYDVRITQVPLGKLLTGFKVEDAGTTASVRGRVQLRGTGDSVRASLASADGRIALFFPVGTLWVRNTELAELDLQNFLTALIGKKLKEPRRINCGIAAFTITKGRAIADPIVFDTNKSVFRGSGGFNFGDESLEMALEGDSKQFSLFSAQSPIGLRGWFAEPRINVISGELLTRIGAGLALGIIATPFAAVAAFVDPGDAKDQDCTAILAGKRDTPAGRRANARAKR